MAKQVHIRLDDAVYEAISTYNTEKNINLQDMVTTAIMQFLSR